MKKRIVCAVLVSLLLVLTAYTVGFTQLTKIQGSTYVYPDDFPGQTLQEAIDNAIVVDEDTIVVRAGTYNVHLEINKSITLEGFDRTTTILDGVNVAFGNVINMTACHVTIREFTIENGRTGIDINSSYNNVSGNIVKDNENGIWIHLSKDNELSDNEIKDNTHNFGVTVGGNFSFFNHTIGPSNTVNGKPVYYWVDHHNEQIPSDAGYVAVIDSTNITVKDLDLSNNIQGVVFMNTKDSAIENVTCSYSRGTGLYLCNSSNNLIAGNVASNNPNGFGLYLSNSGNNVVADNVASNNENGIALEFSSSNNSVTGNLVSHCIEVGLTLDSNCNDNVLCNNEVSNNAFGIILAESHNNTFFENTVSNHYFYAITFYRSNDTVFFHNNIFAPPQFAALAISPASNILDNGHEGNYWSSYGGEDMNGDGIIDTSYEINADNVDRYPLKRKWEPIREFQVSRGYKNATVTSFSNSTLASFNFHKDLKQISFNITSGANGFCNITIPRDWLDGPFELYVYDTPTAFDLKQNATHSILYFTYGPCTKHIKITGTKLTHILGDINNDGIVDIVDIVMVALNFGYEDQG